MGPGIQGCTSQWSLDCAYACNALFVWQIPRLHCIAYVTVTAQSQSLPFSDMALAAGNHVEHSPCEEQSILYAFLRSKGLPGDAQRLHAVISWLEQHEVSCPSDFNGLGTIGSLAGADQMPETVLEFLQSLVQARHTFVRDACALVMFLRHRSLKAARRTHYRNSSLLTKCSLNRRGHALRCHLAPVSGLSVARHHAVGSGLAS